MRLFKVLVDGKSCHGGDLQWSLPHHDGTRWVPGDWHEIDGAIQICSRGIHGTKDPRAWLKHGCRVWSMEAQGIAGWEGDKFVCRRARLLRPCHHPQWWRKAERFIDSLKDVKWCQPDGKPEKDWVLFEADGLAAAWAAAGAAAWAAAGDAAGAAARAAAWAAAGDATGAAAWVAAWVAARAAAWVAAGDAAGDAARAAAGAAARAAAGDAAGDAAGAAARAAARAAAWDAALMARLQICHGLPLDPKDAAHIEARWRVWEKGYCLLCDVNGVLYVYARRKA